MTCPPEQPMYFVNVVKAKQPPPEYEHCCRNETKLMLFGMLNFLSALLPLVMERADVANYNIGFFFLLDEYSSRTVLYVAAIINILLGFMVWRGVSERSVEHVDVYVRASIMMMILNIILFVGITCFFSLEHWRPAFYDYANAKLDMCTTKVDCARVVELADSMQLLYQMFPLVFLFDAILTLGIYRVGKDFMAEITDQC